MVTGSYREESTCRVLREVLDWRQRVHPKWRTVRVLYMEDEVGLTRLRKRVYPT